MNKPFAMHSQLSNNVLKLNIKLVVKIFDRLDFIFRILLKVNIFDPKINGDIKWHLPILFLYLFCGQKSPKYVTGIKTLIFNLFLISVQKSYWLLWRRFNVLTSFQQSQNVHTNVMSDELKPKYFSGNHVNFVEITFLKLFWQRYLKDICNRVIFIMCSYRSFSIPLNQDDCLCTERWKSRKRLWTGKIQDGFFCFLYN